MSFMELAKNRYSERYFSSRPVEDEKLAQILEAGRIAPTGCNYQPQRIYVIRSREAMEKVIFRHTTSIGIRRQEMARTRLDRESRTILTPLGEAMVKICFYRGEMYCYPEHESIAQLAEKNDMGYPEVYHVVKDHAMRSILSELMKDE